MSMFPSNLRFLNGYGGAGGGGGTGPMAGMGPWGMGIGMGLSALGGFMGGQSANRAARRQGDEYGQYTGEGFQRLWNMIYGQQGMHPGSFSQPGMGAPTPTANSLLGRMGGLATIQSHTGQEIIDNYRAGTGRLMNYAGGSEALARQWGRGREGIIDRDFNDQLTDMNRAGDAALAAGGFNSPTYRANQYGANADAVGRERQRAKQDLAEGQIDRQLATRGGTLGMLSGRESGDTMLQGQNLSEYLRLLQQPMNLEYQAMTSPIANPWLGNMPPQGGQSGAGNAFSVMGSGLGALGGQQYGMDQMAMLLRQFPQLLQMQG